MIDIRVNNKDNSATILLRPNNSASWRFNMYLLAGITLSLFTISTYFALLGLWMVFPFAGLEVIALFICLYLRLRANNSVETITFDRENVSVERCCYQEEYSWKAYRAWTKLLVNPPSYRGHPKQVYLRSHGKQLELGAFLNKQDKEALIRELKTLVSV